MGLFTNNDELFELMSKSQDRQKASSTSSSSNSRSRDDSSSKQTVRKRSSGSFGARRITQAEPEFFEVDGDALIVVDDGWTLEGDEEETEGSTFAIRSDTAIVGACLAFGLVVGAFLVGRTGQTESATAAAPPAAVMTVPSATISAAQPTTVPAGQPRVIPTAVVGGFTRSAAAAPQASAPAGVPKVEQAPAARQAAKGKYLLVVCTTTPVNGRKVAKWLNEQARSPIFGRADLEAYTTRKGVVRIRGFKLCDKQVLRQVKATNDPLGGSGTFHSAYFKRS
jgi:hypothetical protein